MEKDINYICKVKNHKNNFRILRRNWERSLIEEKW